MSTGVKVWLWFVLIANALSGIAAIPVALLAPVAWISVLLEAAMVVGVCMLLFGQKKVGFYIMCGTLFAAFLINVIVLQGGVVRNAISGVLCPLITYLLLRGSWEELN